MCGLASLAILDSAGLSQTGNFWRQKQERDHRVDYLKIGLFLKFMADGGDVWKRCGLFKSFPNESRKGQIRMQH